ncbi:MAG: hypothetical protein AB3N28_13920 [Kordiimonas sp.]
MNGLFPLYLASKAAHTMRYVHGKNPHASDDPWYGADEVKPERYTRRLIDNFVDEILQPPEEARVVGFKEIRFHEAGAEDFEPFLDFIYENFEACKFIFNTRPWEEVAQSGWWASMKSARVQEIIEGADALYESYLKKYPERAIRMRHEVTRENVSAFQPLFEFLGEEYDEAKVQLVTDRRLGHSGI